jgi:hypothetical protein
VSPRFSMCASGWAERQSVTVDAIFSARNAQTVFFNCSIQVF